MLTEISNARQIPCEGTRRWWTDADMDLIVWYTAGGDMTGFQLCYDKKGNEKALTWYKDRGFVHEKVDGGEALPVQNRTPILVADGQFPRDRVTAAFMNAADEVEPAVAGMVVQALKNLDETKIFRPIP